MDFSAAKQARNAARTRVVNISKTFNQLFDSGFDTPEKKKKLIKVGKVWGSCVVRLSEIQDTFLTFCKEADLEDITDEEFQFDEDVITPVQLKISDLLQWDYSSGAVDCLTDVNPVSSSCDQEDAISCGEPVSRSFCGTSSPLQSPSSPHLAGGGTGCRESGAVELHDVVERTPPSSLQFPSSSYLAGGGTGCQETLHDVVERSGVESTRQRDVTPPSSPVADLPSREEIETASLPLVLGPADAASVTCLLCGVSEHPVQQCHVYLALLTLRPDPVLPRPKMTCCSCEPPVAVGRGGDQCLICAHWPVSVCSVCSCAPLFSDKHTHTYNIRPPDLIT